jgi:hypothetical protein
MRAQIVYYTNTATPLPSGLYSGHRSSRTNVLYAPELRSVYVQEHGRFPQKKKSMGVTDGASSRCFFVGEFTAVARRARLPREERSPFNRDHYAVRTDHARAVVLLLLPPRASRRLPCAHARRRPGGRCVCMDLMSMHK